MIEIDNNTYEGEIEQLDEGTRVRFYIVAYDVLGNMVKSNTKEYIIPNTSLIFSITIVLLLIVIIILISLMILKRRSKIRKYLNKHQSSLIRENDNNENK